MKAIFVLGAATVVLAGCTIKDPNPAPIALDLIVQEMQARCNVDSRSEYQKYRCLMWDSVAACQPAYYASAASNLRLDADWSNWRDGLISAEGEITEESGITSTALELLNCGITENKDKLALCKEAILLKDTCFQNQMQIVVDVIFRGNKVTAPAAASVPKSAAETTGLSPKDVQEVKKHIRYVLQTNSIRRPEFDRAFETGASCSEALIEAQKDEGGGAAAERLIDAWGPENVNDHVRAAFGIFCGETPPHLRQQYELRLSEVARLVPTMTNTNSAHEFKVAKAALEKLSDVSLHETPYESLRKCVRTMMTMTQENWDAGGFKLEGAETVDVIRRIRASGYREIALPSKTLCIK
tara:strand:- start:3881 stop:4945 length:1065 start_codon:yes stop_codon:yes gene_type:complete